jgi:hypothetical protein
VRLLVARHHVVGLEAVLDVDRQAAPRLVLDLGRGVRSALREVADVADGGLDDVAVPEEVTQHLGLLGGLDDDELVCHEVRPAAFFLLRPRLSGASGRSR